MGYRVMTQALFEQIAALFGDAAQRQQVEDLTRERDALRARLAAMEMRDCTNAEMMALAEIIQREHHQNTSTVGTFWGPAARAAWRYVRDRLLEETAQGSGEDGRGEGSTGGRASHSMHAATSAEADTRAPAPAPIPDWPDTPICPVSFSGEPPGAAPTPPAAEASGWWKIISQHNGRADCEKTLPAAIDAEVKRREGALRQQLDDMLAHEGMESDRAHAAEIKLAALRERAEVAEARLAVLLDPERERLIAEVVEAYHDQPTELTEAAGRLYRYERARAKGKP